MDMYIPDGAQKPAALMRTQELIIAAHQDDAEIMAYSVISRCKASRRAAAVILADGAGSPRAGEYSGFTDAQMAEARAEEQMEAARLAGYSFLCQLSLPSYAIKSASDGRAVSGIAEIIAAVRPKVIWTHNLADRHDTHAAAALRVCAAIASLPEDARPEKMYGMEVWRSLDWVCSPRRTVLDASSDVVLQRALVDAHRTQVLGGKAYTDAALGRRYANATFCVSHSTDAVSMAELALDMSDIIGGLSPREYIKRETEALAADISARLSALEG